MDLHEIFARDVADDILVRQGMFITGLIILILGIIMIIYGYIKRNGNEIQKAHTCFGFAVSVLGILIVILGKVSENYIIAALLGFFFTIITACILYQKIQKVREIQKRINEKIIGKIKDKTNKRIS